MRILLVQVPTSHFGAKEKVYPLGLSRLSALVPDNFSKHAIDMNLYPDPWPVLSDILKDFKPDIAALSFRNIDPLTDHRVSYLSSLNTSAKMTRAIVPDAKILAGGPAFTLFAKRLMVEIPEIDCGLMGEGEAVFKNILQNSKGAKNIPGLLWRKNKNIICNKPENCAKIDSLPKIDTESFDPQKYLSGNSYVAAMGIEGKRGCDLRCSYCMYPYLGGGKIKLRSPEKIVDEMEYFKNECGADLLHFTDSVVNRPADHFEAVCREILQRKLKIGWTGFFRETDLTPKILALAQKAGLLAVYFSADGLTDHGLKVLNKQMTKDHIIRAARITAESGILTICHFLINLPGETLKHVKESFEMINRILDIHAPAGNLGAVIFNNIRLYPDAPITKKLLKEGLISPETDLLFPVYYNPEMYSHILHELETSCHAAGVFSRLNIKESINENSCA